MTCNSIFEKNALKTFKRITADLEQDDTITISVSDLEKFVLEAISEALKKK